MAKYLKINSKKGFIEDTAAIAHEKFNRMRHVILGCMLGDFNNFGEYFVRPEIVEELIKMDKHIIDTIDNIELCESFLKLDKPITFAVTFQNDKATLSLLEKVHYGANFKLNGGSYSDVNEYILAEIETSGVVDKNVVYRMWNIKQHGGEALDIFHMDEETLAKYAGVVRRFKYLLVANKKLLQKEEKIEEIEATYFNKMMVILARYPKLKVAVEKEIKTQLDEKNGLLRLDKPNLMKTINEIVSDAIEDNIDILDEKEKKTFEAERHNVENEYNIEITKEIDIKTEKVEQKDLNADPIVVPMIEIFGEEDRKSAEELGKEFVETEKKVEERVQDDIVTLATGKVPENTIEKEESKNLIAESIKGEDNKENNEEKDTEKNNQISDFQRAVLAEANKEKNRTKNEKLDAMKGIIAIATKTKQENIVITPKGVATVTEENKKLVVAEVKDGKVTKAVSVSQKQTNVILQNLTGEKTKVKIQETQAQVVANVDDKTKGKTEEKQTENKKGLVVTAGNTNTNVKTSTKKNTTVSTSTKKDKTNKTPTANNTTTTTTDTKTTTATYIPVDITSKGEKTSKQTGMTEMAMSDLDELDKKIIEENNVINKDDISSDLDKVPEVPPQVPEVHLEAFEERQNSENITEESYTMENSDF